ncbi:sialin [Tribolium castaneum]|uniref:Inorganic phosphate cotransporter-like Protein n=1 Tax=Tribolium castaneum TaxID=7070 RepID=D6WWN0_TRICA|nr:PREDICTED: sialin [Tribolium castaneum]EFA08738.2 Putative inorganic phosphate cotransporter-like Protein [Tribolium castaneum]|eukprot:XP_975071.2 PREDICTED: sialin [Tribolium castaneum]
MASAKTRKWADWLTCTQVLNIMVILGFMFNYMLRVNMTIAVVDMVKKNDTNTTSTSTRFDWSEAQKNDILGSFFWGYVLTELPGGRLAEIVGARRVFGGGMLLASLITVLTPAACHLNYYVVLVLRAFLGFFLGATWPAILPMAAKWIPPMERSKFIANMMASSLGAALTMPVCGFLISSIGWPSVFYVTGAVGIVWSVAWFLLVFDSPAQHPRITIEEKLEIESKIAEGSGGKSVKPSKVPWVKIFTSGPVWAIIITHGCSVFCYFTVVNQLPSYMDHVLHFNIKKNGILSSLPYLGKYAMAVIASYLADRLLKSGRLSRTTTRKAFTTFAVLTPGFLMIIQAFLGMDPVITVVVFTASLFFNGAVTAGYLSNGLDIAPNFSGTIFGMANTLSSFGGWLSTKIVAILTKDEQTFEQWRYVFWILVGTYATGALVYLLLGTGELQKWNSADEEVRVEKEMQPLRRNEKEVLA